MVYTKMKGPKNNLSVDLQLPKGVYINFMFWVSKDSSGKKADGWDTNWGGNYNFYVDGKINPKIINDEKLSFVTAEVKERHFNILEEGITVLIYVLIILAAAFAIQFLKL